MHISSDNPTRFDDSSLFTRINAHAIMSIIRGLRLYERQDKEQRRIRLDYGNISGHNIGLEM